MSTTFRLKNNDIRSYGFAGRLCIAGSGNPTPPEAAKQIIDGRPFSLPPLFEMTEAAMFRSYRGVIATMAQMTRLGRPAIEVFVDGVIAPLTAKDIEGWASDYRARTGTPEPKDHTEHTHELERTMGRSEDPIERQLRLAKADEQSSLAKTVTEAVLAVLRPVTPPTPPPAAPTRGLNDEAPEQHEEPPPLAAGRARPRP